MKAFEKYFRAVLSLMLYKVIPTFETAIIKILAREYSHTTHERHERFLIIKECIPNNLIDLTFIYILYYFAGLNEYSTDHYPVSLSIIIPSLLGALQAFFLKANQ